MEAANARWLQSPTTNESNVLRTFNRDAIGARVAVKSASGSQIATVNPAASYLASNDKRLVFGLGEDALVDQITIHWPAGGVDRFEKIEPNRYYHIMPGGKISSINYQE